MGKLVRRILLIGIASACAMVAPSQAEVAAPKRDRLGTVSGGVNLATTYRGVVLAPERVALRSDIRAAIETVGVREGATFAQGDMLLAFDCRRERAEHNALRATARAAHARASQQRHLNDLGAASLGDVRVADSEAEAASANAQASAAQLAKCRIVAPFDGRVAEMNARAFATPEPGEPLMVVIGSSTLEVEFVASAKALRAVDVGTTFRFVIEETGDSVEGTVDRIGAEIDAASRTVKLFGTLRDAPPRTLPGMTGIATFGPRS